jgi:hypothetical protein
MTLDADDIEAVAQRVAELLGQERPASALAGPRLVDAATLARLLGISRAMVYAKADELGAIRVGSGKRARLRFDPASVITRPKAGSPRRKNLAPHNRRRSRRPSQRSSADLLPIRGSQTRSSGPLRS